MPKFIDYYAESMGRIILWGIMQILAVITCSYLKDWGMPYFSIGAAILTTGGLIVRHRVLKNRKLHEDRRQREKQEEQQEELTRQAMLYRERAMTQSLVLTRLQNNALRRSILQNRPVLQEEITIEDYAEYNRASNVMMTQPVNPQISVKDNTIEKKSSYHIESEIDNIKVSQ